MLYCLPILVRHLYNTRLVNFMVRLTISLSDMFCQRHACACILIPERGDSVSRGRYNSALVTETRRLKRIHYCRGRKSFRLATNRTCARKMRATLQVRCNARNRIRVACIRVTTLQRFTIRRFYVI